MTPAYQNEDRSISEYSPSNAFDFTGIASLLSEMRSGLRTYASECRAALSEYRSKAAAEAPAMVTDRIPQFAADEAAPPLC